MARIRKDQLDAIAEEKKEVFVSRLAQFLVRKLPSKTAALSKEQLDDICRRGMRIAVAHGLITERHAARFVLYMVEMGVDFEDTPAPDWAIRNLADESAPIPRRLEKILGHVIEKSRGSRDGHVG